MCSDFGAQERKSVTVSIVFPSICREVVRPDAMILVFWMLSSKPTFSLSSFTFIKRLFSSLLSSVRVVSSAYLRFLIFLSANLILHIRWPKYWSFSFSISLSNEYPGLISIRIDWLDLLAVQGTLLSLLQHHSSKASILRCSAFFIVQLLHPYMTTGKTKVLTRQTFVSEVISLLFNMLSRLVITFLPRSQCLLISWR